MTFRCCKKQVHTRSLVNNYRQMIQNCVSSWLPLLFYWCICSKLWKFHNWFFYFTCSSYVAQLATCCIYFAVTIIIEVTSSIFQTIIVVFYIKQKTNWWLSWILHRKCERKMSSYFLLILDHLGLCAKFATPCQRWTHLKLTVTYPPH